jgi:hypothetical protein
MPDSEPIIVDPARIAVPLACGVVGFGLLVWSVVGTGSLALGLPVSAFAALLLGYASWSCPPTMTKILSGHVGVILLLLMGASGLCASQCGSMPFYSSVIEGLSTNVVAIGLHAFLLAFGMFCLRVRGVPRWVYCAGHAVAIGGSFFFVWLMAAKQYWCPACVAAHIIVGIQAIEILRLLRRADERVMFLLAVLAVTGGVNAWFHHRAFDRIDNRPGELLRWISSAERPNVPVGIIQGRPEASVAEDVSSQDKERRNEALVSRAIEQAASSQGRHLPMPSRETTEEGGTSGGKATSSLVKSTVGANRPLGVWGDPAAPIKLVANLDPMCAYCEMEVESVLGIKDRIESVKPDVSVDLALVVNKVGGIPHYGARTAAYLIYAASSLGGPQMVAVMRVLMSEPGRKAQNNLHLAKIEAEKNNPDPKIVMNDPLVKKSLQDLFSLIPDSIDRNDLRQALAQRKDEIERKLDATVDRMFEYGVSQSPNLWFYRTAGPSVDPYVIFRGVKEPSVLQYAITKGLGEKSEPVTAPQEQR